MKIAQKYAKELLELCSNIDQKEADKVIDKFASLMIERRQGSLLPEIMKEMELAPEPGTLTVSLITATKASKETTDDLRMSLEKKLDTPITIETSEDPTLLGGAIIRYEDVLLDASVKNRLNILKNRLQSSEL